MNKPNLLIPHPKFHLRKFVLIPLLELAPNFICPKHEMTIMELNNNSKDKSTVEKLLF